MVRFLLDRAMNTRKENTRIERDTFGPIDVPSDRL
jgi:fumarate hydratase class II